MRSATIEVLDADEHGLGGSSYGSDVAGYRSMRNTVCVWRVPSCSRLEQHQ
jgi:hypothetical protein